MQYRFLSLLSVLLCAVQIFAFSNTIYIIREAEKASMGMGGLTPIGRNRASACLVSYFGVTNGKDIGKIISCRPDPDTGKCDAAFQTAAPLASQLGLKVDVTCTTDETTSIKTCLYEVIKNFVATSTKGILVVWASIKDSDEMDQVFDNFDLENDDPEFPEIYPDMVATIKNNVFQNFTSQLCSAVDGNSGTPLTAATTINIAIPTPTPTVAGRRRDLVPQTSTSTPTIMFGIEGSSFGLANASTTSLASLSAITSSQSTTSLLTLPSIESDLPPGIIAPSITAFVPPIATTEPGDASSVVVPERIPIEVDVKVEINVGGHTKPRKGCKSGISLNVTESVSDSTTSIQPVPTTFDVPLETVSSSAQVSSVRDTFTLPSTLPTLSTITSTSIDSVVTGSTTESATPSTAGSTDSAFPLQTPPFGTSGLDRMIRRHKRHGALKL